MNAIFKTRAEMQSEIDRLTAILNTPTLEPFAEAVVAEAKHQIHRYGPEHDVSKSGEDWFWVLGWLAGKAVRAVRDEDFDKALHHVVTSAALLANWHRHLLTQRDGATS